LQALQFTPGEEPRIDTSLPQYGHCPFIRERPIKGAKNGAAMPPRINGIPIMAPIPVAQKILPAIIKRTAKIGPIRQPTTMPSPLTFFVSVDLSLSIMFPLILPPINKRFEKYVCCGLLVVT